jgi:hypothetical protein
MKTMHINGKQVPDGEVPAFDLPTFGNRVKMAKELLKTKGIKGAKVKFFDAVYGAQTKSDSIRTDNLWAGYIEEEQFTINLEEYAKKQKDQTI